MSDTGNGSLQLSSSELCVEHKVSDSEMNVGNKRRKVSASTLVAVESENPEAHLEPVVMKRKRMSGHSFKKKFNEEIVPVKLALGQTEKLTSYKEKELVPSNSEGFLNQILPEQKQAAKVKSPGNEIDCLRNKIKKKCCKRMAKLFQKQGVQCREFEQIWEKKRSNLERDYKLELSIIRSIYGEDITRTDNKLKRLDGKFLKKMKEHTLLKDVEFKKLKAEQLAARDEERQKRAHWLAACRSSEPVADHGPESLGPLSEEVGRGNSSSTDPQNDLGVALSQASVLAGVEQLNQLKNLCHQQIICALPAFPKSVPSKIGAVELNKEVPPVPETVAKEIVDYANPVELSNSSSYEGIDNRDAIGLPDASVTLGVEIDEGVGLPLVEQILEPSEQTKASWTPHHCTSLLPQTSEDQVPCSSISDIIQDVGAQVNPVQDQSAQEVGNQTASPFEVAASVHVNIVQPNIELHDQDAADTSRGEVANLQSSDKFQDQDATGLEDQTTSGIEVANSESIDVVNPVQSSVGAPAVLNCEELLSADVFPICDEPPFIDVESQSHNLERSSSQTSEIADTVVVSHESASQLWENRDLQRNHSGVGSGSQVDLERIFSQTTETADTVVVSHESASQLGGNQDLQSHHFGIGSGSQVNSERISSQTAETADNVVVSHQSASQLGETGDLQSNHFGVGSGSQVNLERISSQTAEVTDTALLSHESTSQLGGNQELQSNHFGIGSESQVIHETSVRVSTSSRNNVAVSQVVNTVELPHQAGLQLGSVGNHYGSGNPFSHNQFTSSSSPPLYATPLQQELGKISKEIEQLQKSHEDMKSQLKSNREKEIREMLAQINSKYNLRLQEAETEFNVKKNGLDKNRSKVLMNRLLAECFSSICGDHYWLRGIQKAAPSSSMQHQTLQHLVRPPLPMAMGHPPVLGQPMATPNIQALQQLLHSNATRHSPITPSPLQTPQHAPAFSFVSSSQPLRPLLISAITPMPTNPGFGGTIRSGAPHLQSHAASYMPTPSFPSNFQYFQHRASQSLQSPPPQPPLMQPSTFQNRPQIPTLLNPSLSAPDFLMDMDDPPNVPASSCLPQINSTFGSFGNVQGNRTSSAAVNTVCLSDDD